MTTTYVGQQRQRVHTPRTQRRDHDLPVRPDGNLIAQTTGGSTTTYTFNELNQLTGVNGPGLTASYAYDPLGNLVSQTVNGATTNSRSIRPGRRGRRFQRPALTTTAAVCSPITPTAWAWSARSVPRDGGYYDSA